MSYMTISSQEKQFFTLFMLSRTSDNTTSQNIGETNAWAVPHLKFWGGPSPQSPLGLRPCSPLQFQILTSILQAYSSCPRPMYRLAIEFKIRTNRLTDLVFV